MKTRKQYQLGDVGLVDCGDRLSSLSVSWNSRGQHLAMASNDRITRLWAVDGPSAREVLAISGHTSQVTRVRFHPQQDSLLCSTAKADVRIWDVRTGNQQKAIGKIDVASLDVAWGTTNDTAHLLAVTVKNGPVAVYDTRKLPNPASGFGSSKSSAKAIGRVYNMDMSSGILVDTCVFSPGGNHLVAATTTRQGLGEVTVADWKQQDSGQRKHSSFPAHTGAIYSLAFSPDGKHLATGGSDAIVGLWDANSMVCTKTISRPTKFVRTVGFSHDSALVGSSSEEDGIDLALAETGQLIGKVGLGGRRGGADEISFHPKAHVVACARCPSSMGQSPPAVTVAKLSFTVANN